MISIIYSDQFLNHDTGFGHPECAARLTAIVEALKTVTWSDQLRWIEPTPINQREVLPYIKQLHTQAYLERLEAITQNGGGWLDADTPLSAQSYDIALLAVSAWLDGIDRVMGPDKTSFILARPPGHHAVKESGMGFCLLSNAAIAAQYALSKPGINKVGILDWDVHHGNGTQNLTQANPNIAYCSLHQYPCYPGTGRPQDRGMYENVLNIPMPPGSIGSDYQLQFEKKVLPFFKEFKPDFLIVSAGYDANADDRLAGILLQPHDYGRFTKYCWECCDRILFGLEGGYDLPSLSKSVIFTLESCLN